MDANELSPSLAKLVLCRYNADGVCMYGESCYFSHDRNSCKYLNLCNFFLRGFCRYGDKCRFDHVKASKLQLQHEASLKSSSSSSPSNNGGCSSSCADSSCSTAVTGQVSSSPASSSTKPTHKTKKTLKTYDSHTHCITNNHTHYEYNDYSSRVDTNSSHTAAASPSFSVLDTSWANAPEFVPSFLSNPLPPPSTFSSYSQAAQSQIIQDNFSIDNYYFPVESNFNDDLSSYSHFPYNSYNSATDATSLDQIVPHKVDELCPLHIAGECSYGDMCPYIHGDQCSICCTNCLHPTDKKARSKHEMDCFIDQKDNIDYAFQLAESANKVCGICMDVVYDKPLAQRQFGILSHCNHVFCLSCLRKWRCQDNYDNEVKRSCPECRVISHFVTPSPYWVEDLKEKDELISKYKQTLSKKDCKYFDKGSGTCPFGIHCFYKHALKNGELVKKEKPRYRQNADGESLLTCAVQLVEFLEVREDRIRDWLELDDEDFFIITATLGGLTTDISNIFDEIATSSISSSSDTS